jgi:hypothetical protein
MADLKGGSVRNFSGSMAEEMEKVMEAEMQALKGHGLPEMGRDERRVMLVAVARGMLNYLKIHEKDIIRNIRLDPGSADDIDAEVEDLEFGAEVQ